MASLHEASQALQESGEKTQASFDVAASPPSDSAYHSTAQDSSFLRVTPGSIIVTSLASSLAEGERYRRMCGCWWSGNMRVLLITAALFMTITIAQTIAAKISKSEALLADCVSMAVDSLTYFLNILVECLKGTRLHRPAQLLVPAISISTLTYFTIRVVQDALPVLQNGSDDGDDVNAYIVLAFAIWGILFDVASVYFFYRNLKRSEGLKLGVNMLAAFLHVGADLARSVTTLIESILIIGFDFNGAITDAWACMIVSTTILIGAAYAFYEWIVDACSGGAPQDMQVKNDRQDC